MKRLGGFILCIILCFGLLSGCGKEKTEPTAIQGELKMVSLTEEKKTEISNTWRMEMGAEFNWNIKDAVGNHRVGFIGMIGNSSVIFVSEEIPAVAVMYDLTVADYTFTHYAPFQIYLCGDGTLHTLAQAYEAGLLTEEQIGQIHARYSVCTEAG